MNNDIYKIEVDRIDSTQWNNHLLGFSDASLYQTFDYGKIRWGLDNISHFILIKNEEIVSMAQLRIIKTPLINRGIAYIPYGPIWKKNNDETDKEALFVMIDKMIAEFANKRKLLLLLRPNYILSDSAEIIEKLNKSGFKKNFKRKPYQSLYVNLNDDLELIRKKLHQKWRNRLNKAEKNDLSIVIGTSLDLFTELKIIYNELLDRKKFKAYVNIDELEMIQKTLPDNLRLHIILCRQNNKTVSGAVFCGNYSTGIYLLGATSKSGMNTQGAYLVQWRIIEFLKAKGCKWYDLGGIDKDENPNVYHFKSGLSEQEIYHIGYYSIGKDLFCKYILQPIINRFNKY